MPGSGRPLVVALVGPAGAGKSVVREALAERGAATLDFDDYSRELLRPGTEQYRCLRAEFGPEVFRPDGSVDRGALGALVFSDSAARERLNAILHPAMLALLREAIASFRSRPTAPLLVVEGAILAQLPTEGWFDRLVLVTARPAIRGQRLQETKGLSGEAANALIRLHDEMGVGRDRADEVVGNDGGLCALKARVDELWGTLVGGGTE